jgi:hypothetical protein
MVKYEIGKSYKQGERIMMESDSVTYFRKGEQWYEYVEGRKPEERKINVILV